MPTQRYETIAQAFERTGISRNTLRRRIATGELPAFMTGRRILRPRPEDVDRLLKPRYNRPVAVRGTGMARRQEKRTFGEISPLPSGRYRARHRGPDGERYTAPVTFLSRMDAETWLSAQARKISSGDSSAAHPPRRGLLTLPTRSSWVGTIAARTG